MRKKNIFFKLLILLGIIFIFSCNQNFFPNNDTTTKVEETTNAGYGSVRINIKNSDPSILSQIMPIGMRKFNTRTIMPDLSTDNIDFYDLTGDGPSDASFDLIDLNITGDYTVNDLEVGDWTITVTGKDSEGKIVARGSSSVTITNGVTANATVDVSPVKTASGTGTIDVSADWDPAIIVSSANSTINILGDSLYTNLTTPALAINSNRLSFSINKLSGYYTIIISLKDGSDKLLATLFETVYVYDNLTTYWKKSLSTGEINAPPAAPTGLTINEGSNKLILNWNDISDVETGYKIYSKIDPATYSLLAGLPASSVGFEYTSPTADTTIDYRVTAYNDFGESVPLEASYNLVSPAVLEVLNPADESTDVDVTTNIKIRFNKSMDTSAIGEIKIYDGSSDQTLNTANAYFVFSTTDTNKPNDTLTIISKSPAPYGIACSNFRVNGFKDVFGTSTAYTIPDYNFTFKAAPPKFALGFPKIDNVTVNSFCINAIVDQGATVFFRILPDGSLAPGAAEVQTYANGGFGVLANIITRRVSIASIAPDTEYDVYIVAKSGFGFTQVAKFDIKTSSTSDVLFSENFEDEAPGWTPDGGMFIPSGNGNPDWDDSIFYPTNIFSKKITDILTGSNATKKFLINKSPTTVTPSLLGASFNEATKRYTVVEYDFYTPIVGLTIPVCHIIASDGTADLNGTGANSIAVHIKVDAAAIGSERIKYVTGEDSDLNSLLDGTTILTSITWTNLIWYRMQLVLDQSDNSVDIKLLNKNLNSVYTAVGLPYNNSSAGNIKKVWFGTSNTSELYIDNILIYQTETDPKVSAPTIILNKKGSGPVRQNPFIDVDFIGSVDLSSIQYKIGELGAYTALTTDGTTNVTLSGKTYFPEVKISITDFNAMPEGEKRIYFKVTDVSSNSTESVEYFTIIKDTMPPQIKNATIAPDNSFIKLDFSEKVWGDAFMLQAIDTGDLAITFHTAGNITGATIDGLFANVELNELLAGGNGYETVFVKISPVPAGNKPDGTETFSIKSGANMIFDRVGNSGPETTSAIMTFNDKKPPTIVYKSPENSVKSGLDSDLIFTFDEAVSAGAGKYIYIKKISDNSTFRSFLATDDTKVVKTANQVKLIVDGYFEPNTEYYVTMDAGAFADAKGNYSVGYSDNTFWKFSSGLNFTEMIKVDGVIDNSYTQSAGGTSFIHNISDFYIGKYEVTYQLWYEVRFWADIDNGGSYTFANKGQEGNDGTAGFAPTANNYEPVTYVSWRDAIVWCNAYSEKMGLTPVYKDRTTDAIIKNSSNAVSCDTAVCDWSASGYRLPSEGEWQYAASYKDGSSWTPYNWASGAADGTDASTAFVAWYSVNAGGTTHNVGTRQANQLGAYDMSGNILEWCWDWEVSYPTDLTEDYRGPVSGLYREQRGGPYSYGYSSLFVGARVADVPYSVVTNLGFRVARSFDATPPAITQIGSPFDGTFKASDNITIDVTFDENVYIQSGAPNLSLNSGGSATYSSGSGTKKLSFNYMVKSGENTSDLNVTSVNLSNSTIKDGFGNNADLSLPSAENNLADNNNIAVDTIAPDFVSAIMSADNSYITVTFSENVYTNYTYPGPSIGELTSDDFKFEYIPNGSPTTVTLDSITKIDMKTIQFNLNLAGTFNGNEKVKISPFIGNTIFDTVGNTMLMMQTTGEISFFKKLTYNGNGATGGSAPIDSAGYSTGDTVNVANGGSLVKVWEGITFNLIGWNTQADGMGTTYPLTGGTFIIGSTNVTLYAKWSALRCTGPAGGLIFFDKGDYTNGWRYLEAAPQSTEWAAKVWGGHGTDVTGADGQVIGTGKQNTIDIVAQYGNAEPYAGKTDYAAKLCSDLVYNNYNDWFLPSIQEIYKVFNNLHKGGLDENNVNYSSVGGFGGTYYWTSSEHTSLYAKWVRFDIGSDSVTNKYDTNLLTRAVRSFGDFATPPTVGDKNIGLGGITSNSVTLNWNSADDGGMTPIGSLQYKVYYSTTAANVSDVTACETIGTPAGYYMTGALNKTVTGLNAGTTYYFNVVVRDNSGNKAYYMAKSTTTMW